MGEQTITIFYPFFFLNDTSKNSKVGQLVQFISSLTIHGQKQLQIASPVL